MSIEAMKLALEALEMWCPMTATYLNTRDEAITALRQAIAELEQAQPVAWMSPGKERIEFSRTDTVYGSHTIPLYTAPPPRQPLTDEQISKLWDGHTVPVFGKTGINPIVFARAIEAAHGIGGEK